MKQDQINTLYRLSSASHNELVIGLKNQVVRVPRKEEISDPTKRGLKERSVARHPTKAIRRIVQSLLG